MIVVKIGGNQEIKTKELTKDIIKLKKKIVLVHGCSFQADLISERLGFKPKFVKTESGFTTRVTDKKQLESFFFAAMKVNKEIVKEFYLLKQKAIGLTGVDCATAIGQKRKYLRIIENGKKKVLRNDFTGKTTKINHETIKFLLQKKIIPVIAPLLVDKKGSFLNVDGDLLAAEIAISLKAKKLVILSNIHGVYKKPKDPSSKIKKIKLKKISEIIKKYAKGKMKKKLLAAKIAGKKDIKTIISFSGNKNPVSNALKGNGTVIE